MHSFLLGLLLVIGLVVAVLIVAVVVYILAKAVTAGILSATRYYKQKDESKRPSHF